MAIQAGEHTYMGEQELHDCLDAFAGLEGLPDFEYFVEDVEYGSNAWDWCSQKWDISAEDEKEITVFQVNIEFHGLGQECCYEHYPKHDPDFWQEAFEEYADKHFSQYRCDNITLLV